MANTNLYHDLILDHYRNPRNFGILPEADVVLREENVGCGDEIEIFLTINLPRGKAGHQPLTIRQLCWRGRGCAISMAGASMLAERALKIREVREIMEIREEEIVAMLGGEISPTRMKCATLALTALRRALSARTSNS